jgi:hypothetical protein
MNSVAVIKPTRKEFNFPDKFYCFSLQNLIRIHENVFQLEALMHECMDCHYFPIRVFMYIDFVIEWAINIF